MHYIILTSAALFNISPQNLAYYLTPHDNHCYGRLSLWTLAAEKRRGVMQMTSHCLEFLHLGNITELLTN